jgi:hypothetical protein
MAICGQSSCRWLLTRWLTRYETIAVSGVLPSPVSPRDDFLELLRNLDPSDAATRHSDSPPLAGHGTLDERSPDDPIKVG